MQCSACNVEYHRHSRLKLTCVPWRARAAMPFSGDSDLDSALWAPMVDRGRAIFEHWSNRRPGRVDDYAGIGDIGSPAVAPPVPVESRPVECVPVPTGVASLRGGSARVVSQEEVLDLALRSEARGTTGSACSDRAQPVEETTEAVGTFGRGGGASAAATSMLEDSPMAGPCRAPTRKTVDTSHAPDLTGPALESHWYDAAWDAAAAAVSTGSSSLATAEVRDLDYLDLFVGGGSVSSVLAASGHSSDSFDAAVDPVCDILSERGFRIAMERASRVRRGGLIVAGPPCSLWTFMSSSVHKRTAENPGGDSTHRGVRMSNLLVSNLVVLLRHAHARGVHWVVEQPMTSRMWSFSPMATLISTCRAARVSTYMGAFNHRQCKPSVLMGTLPTLESLGRTLSDVPAAVRRASGQPAVLGYKRDAKGRVTGNKYLHQSAAYTVEFGQAILCAWKVADTGSGAAPVAPWALARTSMCDE